jgi:hypothetical protein
VLDPFPGGGGFASRLPIELPFARGLVAEALDRQRAGGRPLPPTFELWEPFLHDQLPPAEDEETVRPTAVAARGGAPFDLKTADELLDHPAFGDWLLPPQPVLAAIAEIPAPQSKRWTQQQYKPLADRLFNAVDIARMCGALERQAQLLNVDGDRETSEIASRAAVTLAATNARTLPKHALIRRLLEHSVTFALQPLMDLDDIPDDPFVEF